MTEILITRIELELRMETSENMNASENMNISLEIEGSSGVVEVVGLLEMAKHQYINQKAEGAV